MNNGVFWKAMRLLAHPASLLALTALALNDHLLRRLWPSWWTGKLGDFAWLFFMPFVAAALIALLAGRRARSGWVGALACIAVGGVFALAKTIPAVHAAVVATASVLFGFPVGWRRDPTDLIALITVVAAWRLWDADGRRREQRASAPSRVPARAVPLLALAALLTVANSPAPAYGIDKIVAQNGVLLACDSWHTYISADGGLTWAPLDDQSAEPASTQVSDESGLTASPLAVPTQESGPNFESPLATPTDTDAAAELSSSVASGEVDTCSGYHGEPQARLKLVVDPSQRGVLYSIAPGSPIQRSTDGGKTWKPEMKVQPLTPREVRPLEHRPIYGATNTFFQGPLDGVVDPVTGNAVFAMSLQGVLVRLASGEWRWAAVGDYSHPSELQGLLGEALLATGFGLAAAATLALLTVGGSLTYGALMVGMWLLWIASAFAFPPALSRGTSALAGYGLLFAAAFLGFIATAERLLAAPGLSWRSVARIAATALAGATLVFVPYLLWAAGGLPRYGLAVTAATLLGAAVLYAGWRWTKR